MATFLVGAWNAFVTALSRQDPRTMEWKFIANPGYIVFILCSYLYVCKIWGPRFMENRKPYNLRTAIAVYNLLQVLTNMYFLYKMMYHTFWSAGYSPICQGLTYERTFHSLRLLDIFYYYLFLRMFDFLDTAFFVMQKKFSHVTVLHIVHHTIVIFNGWLFLRAGSDGQPVLGVCTNAFVHIIMYIYYFLASLGPSVRKYLWWKRYLTTIQIAQFVWMGWHALIPAFVDCGYPADNILIALPQILLILFLFINFYVHAYKTECPTATGEKCVKMCFIQAGTHQDSVNSSSCNGSEKKKK
ncbi:very long chain fatty acid elongase AAEL008004-like [Ornithodoros turicata]|uniref:very long chain fatty acid elongase AAEL008004-like n=1 Tax=Ornithodoros turicata TaxID=34597 RepID=UPI003138B3ED